MQSVEELAFDVEFMSFEVDKADKLRIISSDSNFTDFLSDENTLKLEQGKLFLYDIVDKEDRENVVRLICRKNERYAYFNFFIINSKGKKILIHCAAQNIPETSICSLTIADVSRSERKTQKLQKRADALRSLIDEINVGICLFKVNKDMHFEAVNINKACCSFFGTERELLFDKAFRIDDLIYKDDKSTVFQAIGKSIATKQPIDLVVRVITHKGSYLWCKFNAAVYRYDEDNCPVFYATFTDVTELMDKKRRKH